MTYWENWWDDNNGIRLSAEDGDRVIKVRRVGNGNIRFTEACDEYFHVEMSKEDAINALKELIDWIG